MVTAKKNELPEIVIRSEADAYSILQLALDGKVEPYSTIRFDGWPTLNLYLKGEKFEQSITPTVMRGLLELQRGVYRSYASAKFDAPSKRLTETEKDSLEIKVSVKGGSSSFEINFQEIALKLVDHLATRMNPTEVLYTVVAIACLYFGRSAYGHYLEDRRETRMKEIGDETQRKLIESIRFSSEEETKRAKIIADLSARDHRVENISRLAHDSHTEVVKSIAAGTEGRVADITVSPAVSEILTQNARRSSNEVRLDGVYRLLKLDWSDPNKFKVRVHNPTSGLQLDAVVQDDSLTGKYKDALKAAEWSRALVKLQINAKLLGDDYRDAVILSAEPVELRPNSSDGGA